MANPHQYSHFKIHCVRTSSMNSPKLPLYPDLNPATKSQCQDCQYIDWSFRTSPSANFTHFILRSFYPPHTSRRPSPHKHWNNIITIIIATPSVVVVWLGFAVFLSVTSCTRWQTFTRNVCLSKCWIYNCVSPPLCPLPVVLSTLLDALLHPLNCVCGSPCLAFDCCECLIELLAAWVVGGLTVAAGSDLWASWYVRCLIKSTIVHPGSLSLVLLIWYQTRLPIIFSLLYIQSQVVRRSSGYSSYQSPGSWIDSGWVVYRQILCGGSGYRYANVIAGKWGSDSRSIGL